MTIEKRCRSLSFSALIPKARLYELREERHKALPSSFMAEALNKLLCCYHGDLCCVGCFLASCFNRLSRVIR